MTEFVDYPFDLDLSEFAVEAEKRIYDLVGVVKHIGSTIGSGHYIAFCKLDGKWHEFNDKIVRPVDAKDVVSKDAYVLFYEEKEEAAEVKEEEQEERGEAEKKKQKRENEDEDEEGATVVVDVSLAPD